MDFEDDQVDLQRVVENCAFTHIHELEQKAAELLAMKAALEHLVLCCHGDDRPECPILDGLARATAVPTVASAAKHGVARRVSRDAGVSAQPARRRRRS